MKIRSNRRIPWALAAVASVADLILIWVWVFRPPVADDLWMRMAGASEDSPARRFQFWFEGELAPSTPTGLISILRPTEVVILAALLLALAVFSALTVKPWLGPWLEARLAARVRLPRPRLRVRSALLAVGIVAVVLGWEIQSWKTWPLRHAYHLRAISLAASETQLLEYLRDSQSELDRVEAMIAKDQVSQISGYNPWSKNLQGMIGALRWKYRTRRALARLVDELAHVRRLRQKYEQATAHPWPPQPPDPPEPDRLFNDDPMFSINNHDNGGALAAYGEVIRLEPSNAWALDGRAWIWATCPDPRFRDGPRAVASATRACELLDWNDPVTLDTLAAALAESGDFPAAVRRQESAIEHLDANDREQKLYRERLALYQAGRPYRDVRAKPHAVIATRRQAPASASMPAGPTTHESKAKMGTPGAPPS